MRQRCVCLRPTASLRAWCRRSKLASSTMTALQRLRSSKALLRGTMRLEEHTSELQSLMRTSYAVFCLHKKTDSSTYSHFHLYRNSSTFTLVDSHEPPPT